MHPNTRKCTNTWVSIPTRGTGCVHCEKFRCDFMAHTWALIAPFQPVLHRVLCSNETLPNAPKHYKMHQNMNLGSSGMDRVGSLQNVPMRLRGTNFCINCSSSAHFTLSFNAVMKPSKMHPNATKRTNTCIKGPMGWIGCAHCEKFRCDFMSQTCALIAPVQPILHRVYCHNKCSQMPPNTMKRTITWV